MKTYSFRIPLCDNPAYARDPFLFKCSTNITTFLLLGETETEREWRKERSTEIERERERKRERERERERCIYR